MMADLVALDRCSACLFLTPNPLVVRTQQGVAIKRIVKSLLQIVYSVPSKSTIVDRVVFLLRRSIYCDVSRNRQGWQFRMHASSAALIFWPVQLTAMRAR